MPWAQDAVIRAARTGAFGHLHARFAFVRIKDGGIGATGKQRRIGKNVSTLVGGRIAHRAAAKTVATCRNQRLARFYARLGLRRFALVWIELFRADRTARFVSRAQQATDVNVAVLPCTAIAVEETVLVDGVLIVAWNPGREATFIIVERTGAFRIVAVGAAVAVVVLAVSALRGAWNAIGRG